MATYLDVQNLVAELAKVWLEVVEGEVRDGDLLITGSFTVRVPRPNPDDGQKVIAVVISDWLQLVTDDACEVIRG